MTPLMGPRPRHSYSSELQQCLCRLTCQHLGNYSWTPVCATSIIRQEESASPSTYKQYNSIRQCIVECERFEYLQVQRSGAARGEEGKLPPYGWTSKNYVICVCFHCHGTSSYHTTNTLQGRRAKSNVDTQTIQPGLGDFVL